jgi:autophagy-related protein 27
MGKANQGGGDFAVCAIKHLWDAEKGKDAITEVIPIAGELANHGGKAFEFKTQRLSTSDSPDDSGKEGVRLTLTGGIYKEREQRAIIEFRCNKTLKGDEGEWESEEEYVPGKEEERRDDKETPSPPEGEGTPEKQRLKDGAALVWEGYKTSSDGKVDTLFLTWNTKYACENAAQEEPPVEQKASWGFFTWMVIL